MPRRLPLPSNLSLPVATPLTERDWLHAQLSDLLNVITLCELHDRLTLEHLLPVSLCVGQTHTYVQLCTDSATSLQHWQNSATNQYKCYRCVRPTVTMATSFFKWYMVMLHRRPIATKSLTSAVIMGGGDIIQQSIEQWDAIKHKFQWQTQKLKADADHDTEMGLIHSSSSGSRSSLTSVNEHLSDRSIQYDLQRCLRMSAFGLVIVGPLCHQW